VITIPNVKINAQYRVFSHVNVEIRRQNQFPDQVNMNLIYSDTDIQVQFISTAHDRQVKRIDDFRSTKDDKGCNMGRGEWFKKVEL
jgi:hypothetical protein